MAMMDALSALNSLTSNQARPGSNAQLLLDRQARLDEMKRNMALSGLSKGADGSIASGFASGATPEDISGLEEDISGDPFTGKAEQARVAGVEKQNAEDIRYKDPNAVTQRKDALAEALAKAEAPAKAAGAAQLAVEQEKGRNDRTLQNDLFANTDKLVHPNGAAGSNGSGGSASPDFTTSIDGKGHASFAQIKVPQQVQAQQHAAAAGLAQIPQTREMIDNLSSKGMMGPFTSRAESFGASTGLDPLMEMIHVVPAGGSNAFNDFKTQLSLIKSNLAYAHGAARGGSSPAMQQRFDALLNPNQSKEALHGGLTAAERWLTAYAGAKSSDELDRADAELGVTPGAQYQRPAGGEDLGRDF